MIRYLTLLAFIVFASLSAHAKKLNFQSVNSVAKEIIRENDYGLINAEMKDIKSFCPKYSLLNNEEKEDFFSNLITVMTSYESGYDTQTFLKENNGNVSAGLLQISYGSLNPLYRKNGCHVIANAEDLKDPRKNIQCGLAIISTLVKKDKHLASGKDLGAGRYWSVLRQPYTVYVKSLKRTVKVGKKNEIIKDLKIISDRCF